MFKIALFMNNSLFTTKKLSILASAGIHMCPNLIRGHIFEVSGHQQFIIGPITGPLARY
jgi:hypothetical protein